MSPLMPTESRAQPEDGALVAQHKSNCHLILVGHDGSEDGCFGCTCRAGKAGALVAELSAEHTMLGLEAQAAALGPHQSAWYYFPGEEHDQLQVKPRYDGEGYRYFFYAGPNAPDPVRRSTAVRLLALSKKGLAE